MSSNNSFWNFFRYIKTAKDSSVKYYQNNKKRLPKNKKNRKACERYQSLSKKKKKEKCMVYKVYFCMIQKSTCRWKTKACWV